VTFFVVDTTSTVSYISFSINRFPGGMRMHGVWQLRMALCVGFMLYLLAMARATSGPTEAPAAFDNQTNGFISQIEFDKAKDEFEENETAETGLGPMYNASSCAACHQNPVTGGISQVTELRAGHNDRVNGFVPAAGGSLINDLAIESSLQEYVPDTETIRTFRAALNTLGDGFVEAVEDATFVALAEQQALQSDGKIAGQVIEVPVLEAPGTTRVGRFGWKNQHASLLSFSADAYLNEMGITNRLVSVENTSMGQSVAAHDTVTDPEDNPNMQAGMQDIDDFAQFMRATKAPPRAASAATPAAIAGSAVFDRIGCNICHIRTLTTAPVGTPINGGTLTVPPALGDKVFHPFGDFLLHDVGTGDGIVQNGGAETQYRLRTAPLWGVRTRSRLMHDGQSLTFADAILRHRGEATEVIRKYRGLNSSEKTQLVSFLGSL
jgi:CxxC motif-containing protein (DUF1111 family)